MTDLDTYRNQIEKILSDTGGGTYLSEMIDQGLRTALGYYSRQAPLSTIDSSITLTSDGREIDISSITDVVSISRVWLPYDAVTPQDPPLFRKFEHWKDSESIYIQDYYPLNGDVLRIWVNKLRTINGLDSATETNVKPEDVAILLDAASAFTILSESTHGVDEVQIDSPSTRATHLLEVAKYKLSRFFAWIGLDENGMAISGAVEADNGNGRGIVTKRLSHTDLYTGQPTIPDWDI